MSKYYDAVEGAQLMGIKAATIRSWVHRGYLAPGTYQGGRLKWTQNQLTRAKAQAQPHLADAARNGGTAGCACGTQVQLSHRDDDVIVRCQACDVTIVVTREGLVDPESKIRRPRSLDLRETAVDPDEQYNGSGMRIRALEMYQRELATGPQVYFIKLGPYAKIGTSVDVRRRISSLSLNMGHLMATIDGGTAEERATHMRFGHLSAFGEWFYLRDELLSFVQARQKEQIQEVLKHIRESNLTISAPAATL